MTIMKRNSSMDQLAIPKPKPAPTSLPSSDSEDGDSILMEAHPPQTWGAHSGTTGNRKRLLSKQLSMKETTREAKWEKRRRQILHRRHAMMMEGSGTNYEDESNATVQVSSTPVTESEAETETRDTTTAATATAATPALEIKGSSLLMRRRMRVRSLTDEDVDELRGSIELGFGFNEENGGENLCDTLPALNLYFAVNRQLSDPKLCSPGSTPTPPSSASPVCGTPIPSPRSPNQQQQIGTDDWKICNPGDNPQHVKTRLRHWAQVVACSVRQSC